MAYRSLLVLNSDITFTYPPTMCFFAGADSLIITAGVQGFIEAKKSTLKIRMDDTVNKAIHNLRIGDLRVRIGSTQQTRFIGNESK